MCCAEGWKISTQMDLLGDKNQDMTLQQILNFVEAKESGKRSAFHLLLPQVADALAGCSYRKQKRTSAKSPTCKDQDVTCIYCGIKGGTPQQGSDVLNALPLVPDVTVVAGTATLLRCVGTRPARNQ